MRLPAAVEEARRRLAGAGRSALLGLSAAALLLLPAALPAEPLVERREGRLLLSRGPDLFGREEVAQHLGSGLTTSFVFRVTVRDGRGRQASGGALVEIRFELWDEEYLLTATDGVGARRHWTLASPAELDGWWRAPRLALAGTAGLAADTAWRVQLDLSVVPFSAAEERDAQRWFSRSLDRAGETAASELSEATPDGPVDFDRMLHLLMATSIQRSSVLAFRWTFELPPRPGT